MIAGSRTGKSTNSDRTPATTRTRAAPTSGPDRIVRDRPLIAPRDTCRAMQLPQPSPLPPCSHYTTPLGSPGSFRFPAYRGPLTCWASGRMDDEHFDSLRIRGKSFVAAIVKRPWDLAFGEFMPAMIAKGALVTQSGLHTPKVRGYPPACRCALQFNAGSHRRPHTF